MSSEKFDKNGDRKELAYILDSNKPLEDVVVKIRSFIKERIDSIEKDIQEDDIGHVFKRTFIELPFGYENLPIDAISELVMCLSELRDFQNKINNISKQYGIKSASVDVTRSTESGTPIIEITLKHQPKKH